MTISRAQMRRQLYMGGGIASLTPRQQYGLGSIVKSVTKAVKGVGDAVGDIVSSDAGKLALLAAGGYYLGGGAAFGGPGFSFGNIGTSLFGAPQTLTPNGLIGSSATRGLIGAGGKFSLGSGTIANTLGGSALSKGASILGGSALLTSLFGSVDQAQEAYNRDPSYVKSMLEKYGRSVGKEGQELTDFVNQNIAEFGDVSRSDVVSSYEKYYGNRMKAAVGGIMDIPVGEPRQNQQGVNELDYRQEGGFVPVGIKEKADDVPAMLSKNEFVMTADAVRGMGNGSIENGAQKMYNMMKSLENRMA